MKRLLWSLGVLLGAVAIVVLASVFTVMTASAPYVYDDIASVPPSQTALILGAAILQNGSLSPVLRDRADTAVALYQSGKARKILVSGDNSTIAHNEVNPVREYLLEKNIPAEDIFLDHAGFDTYSSMYRARDIFLVSSTIIVTQSFHLPRATFIARTLGITAYGLNADRGRYLPWNYVREWFADAKALWNLATGAKPKYLGETIPITGDGSLSP